MSTEPSSGPSSIWPLWRKNGLIWLALLALLLLSFQVAYLKLGPWTTIIGIAIALIKAALVAVLFMELTTASTLTRLAAAAGLVFLASLFLLTLTDVISRLGLG